MLRSYRYIIVAFFGWVALCAAKPADHQSNNSDRNQQVKTTKRLRPVTAPSTTNSQPSTFVAYPGYDPAPCYHARDHDAADLCAQWRASIAAEKSAHEARRATFWSLIATLLSALGVGGLIYTIWQTKGSLAEARRGNRIAMKANARATRQAVASDITTQRALEYARLNADAAHRLAEASDQGFRKQLRAYLVAGDVEILSVTEDNIFGSLYIKSKGQTPASITEIKYSAYVGSFPRRTAEDGKFPLHSFLQFSTILVGGDNQKLLFKVQKGDQQKALADHLSYCIYIYGSVDYTDVFGDAHSTKFSYRSEGRWKGVQTPFCPTIAGNSAN